MLMTPNESLTSGENNTTYDAGFFQAAEIGNFVWEDLDGDGVQDFGEPGIPGVQVTLTGTTGDGAPVNLSTTTNGTGFYLFSGLEPGTYKLTFGTPAGGYVLTAQNQGGNDETDSDAAPGTQMTVNEVLTAGESNLTYDAGFFKPASLGDFVWEDLDGDGLQDGIEPGIPNVTVALSGTTGDGTPVNLTTTTGPNGEYSFTNLEPGTYVVTFTTPAGYNTTEQNQGPNDAIDSDANPATGQSDAVVLTSGENDTTIDAGFGRYDLALTKDLSAGTSGPFAPGANVDFVITVTNEGGLPAANVIVTDRPQTGLTIIGFDANGSAVINNGNGTYTIPSLLEGQSVSFIVKTKINNNFTGLTLNNEAEITTDDGDDEDSTPNNDNPNEDDQDDETIPVQHTPSIDIEKYTNGQDADNAPGVIILVPNVAPVVTWTYTVTNTGTLDLTNVVVTDDKEGLICTIPFLASGASQTCTKTGTAMRGMYTNLGSVSGQPVDNNGTPVGTPVTDNDPSNYTGVFINMEKMADKTEICAGEEVTYTLITRMLGGGPGIELRNISATDNNMPGAFVCNGQYWVSCAQNGNVLCDLDGDCILDFVDNNNDNVTEEEFKWTYTTVLNQTTVNIAEDMAEVWYVDPMTGDEMFIGNVGNMDEVTVTVNPTRCAEIGDFVWNDQNGDGVQDDGEPGIPNVPVTLNGTNIDGNPVTLNTTTNGTGFYLFSGLVPGTYTVTFGTPAGGFILTAQNQGGNDTKDSDAAAGTQQTPAEVLVAGESNLTYDAGFFQPASIGNYVWNDLDGDGVQEDGEPGIPNVPVTLTGTTGDGTPVSLTTTTGSNGEYEFTNLEPGTYKLTFGQPAGYTPTPQNQGGDDTTDSDIDPVMLMTPNETLTSGENNTTYDAGFQGNASIGDFVWYDLDKDGVQDGNEDGIPGLTVILTGTTINGLPVNLMDITDANGGYLFTNLNPGTYKVTFSSPGANYFVSPVNAGGNNDEDSDADLITLMSPVETLSPGENDLSIDAGFYVNIKLDKLIVDVSCYDGQNGSVDLTVTGGTPAYTYLWSNGATTEDQSNLAPGSYTVTVTDINGYTASTTAIVTEPLELLTSTTVVNVTCFGAQNGSVDLMVNGGTPGYTYLWSNDATTQDLTNVAAGTYTVTVTDAKGCIKITQATVTEPPVLTPAVSINNISCFDFENGSINLTVTGGTPGYTYAWSNGATSEDILNLAPGVYTVTVTDSRNCATSTSTTIIEPPVLELSTTTETPSCNGDNSGAVDLTVTGGTPSFTYLWSNGATSQDLVNVTTGTYTVTVTDANGCIKTTTATVGDIDALSLTRTVTNVVCFGGTSGAIDLIVSGGTPAFMYNWSNGATTQDLTGIGAGTYSVTVTDANSCTSSTTATVTQPTALNATAVVTPVTCFDGSNGAIDLTVSGGTPGYTYAWSNGQSSEDVSGLTTGEYSVTIRDANNCFMVVTRFIIQPTDIILDVVETDVSCYNGSNGAIDLIVSGGTPGYTYLWSNGAVAQDLNGVPAGTYSVTVTDSQGCADIISATIDQPTQINLSSTNTNVSCNGGANGSINLSVSGGTPGYTYLWSNGATTQDLSGLTAGIYTVTVTDTKGCIATTTATVEENTTLTAIIEADNALCNGSNTGSVTLTVDGGTPNYTYLWSNGAATQNINNVPAATYNVTVTDALGCKVFKTATVGQPPVLTPSAVVTNVSCFGGENGVINISVTGGTADYTYLWSTGETTQDLNGISAGSYTLTVTDANGCFAIITRVVTQPTNLNPALTVTNVNCFGGNNGAIDLSVSGGTPTYTYLWSTGATTQDINNLVEGTYAVTITDMNGCTAVRERTITQPDAIEVNASTEPVTACNGGNDGSISLTVSGGTPAYNYNWADLAGNNDPKNRNNLTAGNYTVTVTDSKGCTAVKVVTVGQLSGIELVATPTPTTCEDDNDGAVNLTVSGGSPSYNFLWSNGANTQSISGLVAGNYSVTVTDQDGCTAVASTTVIEPILTLMINTTPVSCRNGNNGAVDLTVSGGTPGYTYQWSNGASSQDLNNVTAGTYFVTVTDVNGCSKTRTAVVTQPTALSLSVVPSPVSCNGGANGGINLSVSGGTPNYTYLWSNGTTTQDLNNVQAGAYTVTVTDQNGCTGTTTATITQPTVITLTAVPNGPACIGSNNSGITLTVTGGTPAFTYLWSNGSVLKNPINLGAGTYTVTVTDANGCTASTSATIVTSPEIILSTDVTNVLCNGSNTGAINLSVSGGVPAFTYNWAHIAGVSNPMDVSNLGAGTYTVTVTDANSCTKSISATVSQPPVINLTATTTKVTCNGGSNGSINLSVSGGTPGYTYQWSNGPNTEDNNNLTAGNYTVTVRDANGCTKALTISVAQPTPLQAFINVAPAGCGSALGGLSATANGGTPAYTFQWSNGAGTPGIFSVQPGTYTVTVTDANGCTTVKTAVLPNIQPITLTATATPISCPGGSDGAINLTVTGGSGNFQYVWTATGFFAETQDISNLSAKIYTVAVTDLNTLCTASLFRVLINPPAMNLTTEVSPAGCTGANGTINLSVSGGTPQYQYLWSSGQTTQDIGGLLAGTYTVTVTDSKGCTKSTTASILGSGGFSATATATEASCSAQNGTITVDITGGNAPFTWSGVGNGTAQTEPFTISGVAGGTYNIVITDASGCSTTVSVTVPQTNGITATAVPSPASCGVANGSVIIDVTGGAGPFTWSGAGNGTAQAEPFTIAGLAAGTYNIVVTNANGCSTTVSVTVTQTEPVTATATPTTASCGAANGTISVNISGGTAPYTWSAANQNGTATTAQFTVSGLTGGQYCVTVTSANSCSTVVCATIPQTNPITATATTTPATCFGGLNGTITVDVAGGTPNYSYNWASNGVTGSGGPISGEPFTITGLAAGNYSVTVTNSNGCTTVVDATVGQPAAFAISAVATPASCVATNGSIVVDVTAGGAAPYSWTTGLGSGNSFTEPFTITGLAPLQYCVTVTNANGCTTFACVTVGQSGGIAATSTTTPATCDDDNGTITVDVTGGSQPYSYQWNNGSGQGSGQNITSEPFTISSLGAGMYVITVTSSNGCTATTMATISQTSGITATATATAAGCNGQAGKITVSVVNGTPNYTYNWTGTSTGTGNSASPSFMIQNLQPGTYHVTVKDGNNCMAMVSVVVSQGQNITANATATPATCNASNGTITVDVNGGTAPYTWTGAGNGTAQTEPFTVSGLAGGNYCITVTDANGCTAVACANVTTTGAIAVTASVVPTPCGITASTVQVNVTGGATPYAYNWTNSNGGSGQLGGINTPAFVITNLSAGTISITVTDANGCAAVTSVIVTQFEALNISATATGPGCGGTSGSATIDVTAGGNSGPYTYNWVSGSNVGNGTAQTEPFTVTGLAPGIYSFTVKNVFNCTATTTVVVPPSGGGSLQLTTTHVCAPTCSGTNGEFGISVAGGTAPYTYSWTGPISGGPITMDTVKIMGLLPGNYTITVTDAGGCSATTTAVMLPPTEMFVAAVPTCATVCGGNDGKITVGVLFGMSNYTYNWSNGDESGSGTATTNEFVIGGLSEGTYSITITGSDGCSEVVTTVVEPISSIVATAVASGAVGCEGGSTGNIVVNVSTGTPSFSYTWSNGTITGNGVANSNMFTISNLGVGTYSITLTDGNGCTGVTSTSIGGNIGGVVFNDYNTDGFMADTEPGLDSVLVYLYECNNPIAVDSVWTNATGAYVFPNLGNFPYRVEFVPVIDSCWIKPAFVGTQSGSTVQFIQSADCNVKVGFFYPGDYCQNAPDIAFSCFAQGKTDDVTSTVIGLVPYEAIDRSEIFGGVEANELVGSVYGLAYDRSRHYLYASAFLKRHVGLGSLGLGGIYRVNYSDTLNPSVTALYTVPNVGDVIRPSDLGAPNAPSMDTDAFGKIGKVGLGDIDISDDENTLWTINLFNRTLVRVDDILTTPTSVELAIASAPNCDNGVFRPLAVKAYRNKIYVGGVCTGENSGVATDLSASVHEYDVKKNMWTMILNWDLHAPNYNHGDVVGSVNQNLAQCREWETWVDEYTERNLVANTGSGEPSAIFNGNFEIIGGGPTGAEFRCRAQALISDIEITREGMMVIAMMDRTGHQFGYRQHRPTTSVGNPISASAGGDIIAAYPVNGVWTLENNGTVPGLDRTSLFGPNSNDGLGGGEFFYDNTRFTHLDADCGGLLYVPGEDELLSAINNPNTSEYNFGGGIVYYDLKLGNTTRNDLTLLDPTANTVGIGMANSIGDLEALCEAAPIQIGNYVWNDLNADGVQDACEDPIPGVSVSLYDATSNALLATTTTNQKGEYYFTGIGTPGQNWISTPGFDSIVSLTAYQIVFGTNGSVNQFNTTTGKLTVNGTAYELTLPNVGAGWYKDWNDSDATIADAANKPWNDFPSIAYTTGMAGCSDHTLDAGFVSDNLANLEACAIEAGSNLGQFNLTEADDQVDPGGNATVTYHLTAAQAQNGQGSLSSPYTGANGTQIFARVLAANGGVVVVPVSLQVNPLPVAYVGQLKVCPDVFDGMMGTFNLNNANAQVTNGINGLTVTYYESQSEAALGANPLPATYNSATKYIWSRVENASGCYDVDILQLVVLSSPGVALNITDNTCTGSASGAITATITDGPANYTFVWSTGVTTGPNANSSSAIINLEAGVFTVTVTDGNACTVVSTAEVKDAVPFSIVPIPNYGPVNAGTQIGPIVLQTTTWGADFSWSGGAVVGLNNGTATSLFPLILPFNTTVGVATVTVTATLGACSDTEEFTISVLNNVNEDNVSVAGLLVTETGDMVEEGYVELEGQMLEHPNVEAIYLTDSDGHFMFDHSLPVGADYTLTPTKDDNPSNGVTTYDLVLLEKHILAMEQLTSPYKLIAADANRSGSITTFDIIELRKLILGIYTDLPNNTSWRFVDQEYVFPNPLNPFESQFPENRSFESIESDRMADNFIAVKIGDVNNSAMPNSLMSGEERSQGMLLFDVDDRIVQAGETFTVSFATAEQVKGYQFTMNTGDLEVLGILPGANMDETNFAVFAAKQAVTTSWSTGGNATFAIRFRARTAGKISNMLAVSGSITKAEAYNLSNDQMEVGFRFQEKDGGVTLAAQPFELYQNQPNPFIDRTVIGFFLPEATTATLSVFDETGRLLHTQKGDFAKGYNAVTLEARDLGANGLLYYKVSTPNDSATRNMIQTRN